MMTLLTFFFVRYNLSEKQQRFFYLFLKIFFIFVFIVLDYIMSKHRFYNPLDFLLHFPRLRPEYA